MLRACKGRVRVKPGQIERIVWSAMTWAAENNPGFNGVPEYTDRGNSFAENECRETASRILAALEPAPDHEQWNAAIEAAKAVVRLVKEDCFAPMTRTREEAFSAACGEVERQIDKLKKGPDHE